MNELHFGQLVGSVYKGGLRVSAQTIGLNGSVGQYLT